MLLWQLSNVSNRLTNMAQNHPMCAVLPIIFINGPSASCRWLHWESIYWRGLRWQPMLARRLGTEVKSRRVRPVNLCPFVGVDLNPYGRHRVDTDVNQSINIISAKNVFIYSFIHSFIYWKTKLTSQHCIIEDYVGIWLWFLRFWLDWCYG